MLYPVADIVEDIKIAIDQNQTENQIIAQEDNTLALDEIIRQKILHAARHLLETSDVAVIDCGKALTGTPTEIGDVGVLSIYKLACPSDYLRLLSLQMTDWKRAVHTAIPQSSAEYSELQSSFMGISGNPERPAVAECVGSDDSRWFELYSSADGSLKTGISRYCPIPKFETADHDDSDTTPDVECLNFPERLYRMLVYQAASLVAATYKETALAQTLMNMVYEGEPKDQAEEQ